ELEKILYFESYVVVDPGTTPLQERELLSEGRYRKLTEEHGPDAFRAGMGAGDPRALEEARGRQAVRRPAGRDEGSDQRGAAEEDLEAAQGHLRLQELGEPAGVADPRGRPGDPPRSPAAGAARRRPLRHLRPERPLPAGHQPQQPPEAPDGAQRPGHHHPQ